MTAVNPPTTNVYPGAGSVYQPPILSVHRQIAACGRIGTISGPGNIAIHSVGSTFISDGIIEGDIVVITDSNLGLKKAVSVILVPEESIVVTGGEVSTNHTNVNFKVGARSIHTFETLAAQLNAAGPWSAMIRWGWLWSNAIAADFAPGITGDLITI